MPPSPAAVVARATSSSVLAKRLGMYWSDELTPRAPSRMACATSSCILTISSGVAGRSALPIT